VCASPAREFGETLRASVRALGREKDVTQPRCGAPKKGGGRCTRLAVVGSGQCHQHQGEWTARAQADRKKKEAEAKKQELRKKKRSWW
jgi:hypothetical protein